MKGLFGLVGLLVTLAIVGFLVKTQLAATRQSVPALQAEAPAPPQSQTQTPPANVRQQAQQLQQQYKLDLDAALQPARAPADE